MYIAGAIMYYGHTIAPVAVKSGRTVPLNYSYEVIGDFRVSVSNLLEVVLHVGKGAEFGVQKWNSAWPRYLQQRRNLKNKVSPLLKVNKYTNLFFFSPSVITIFVCLMTGTFTYKLYIIIYNVYIMFILCI